MSTVMGPYLKGCSSMERCMDWAYLSECAYYEFVAFCISNW